MKIEFLNTWQGRLIEPITRHLEQQAPEIDVFCFQEANTQLQRICGDILPDYTKITVDKNFQGKPRYQQAIYIHPKFEVEDSSTLLTDTEAGGLGLVVALKSNTEPLVHICNFHGVSQPGHKLDIPERIRQTEVIIDFFRHKKGPRVIGGDFNAMPDTRSILMLEEAGYQNLIEDFRVRTTRNRLAWERYPDNKQYFGDYIFVSRDINVAEFSVPAIEISDHLPMIVGIDLS